MRIVSLLPSATEIIMSLNLQDALVGVSHECDYPDLVTKLPKVTKTLIPQDATSGQIDSLVRERLKTHRALYSLDMDSITAARPDLIVTQALCDVCAVAAEEVHAAACSLPGNPDVINLEPTCLDDVFKCMEQIGRAANCVDEANRTIAGLRRRVGQVVERSAGVSHRPSVMLLEWIDPPFGAGHWSPELVEMAGGREVIGRAGQRSAMVDWERIREADPDVMLIACCGFDLARTVEDIPILRGAPGWNELACVRGQRVFMVNGSAYFSRPGPRLVDSLEILANCLHPDLHPLPDGLPAAVRVSDLS